MFVKIKKEFEKWKAESGQGKKSKIIAFLIWRFSDKFLSIIGNELKKGQGRVTLKLAIIIILENGRKFFIKF